MTKVKIRLHATSQPIEHDAFSTYQKEDMFCVRLIANDGKASTTTIKYPMGNIFQVVEIEESRDNWGSS